MCDNLVGAVLPGVDRLRWQQQPPVPRRPVVRIPAEPISVGAAADVTVTVMARKPPAAAKQQQGAVVAAAGGTFGSWPGLGEDSVRHLATLGTLAVRLGGSSQGEGGRMLWHVLSRMPRSLLQVGRGAHEGGQERIVRGDWLARLL
jgi:hypothetical protein